MYVIKCDDLTLYNPAKRDEFLGDPTLNQEVNKAGSLSFVIYPDHKRYDIIDKMKSIITVYRDDKILFKGRVFSDAVNFRKEKKVEVEGLLAYFNDSIVRPYEFSGTVEQYVEFLINQHNNQVSTSQQFKKGNITVADKNDYIVRANEALPTTWAEIEDKLISILGGYIVIRYENDGNYIDYLSDFETVSRQNIEFAVNLMDLENVVQSDILSTCIIPYGAKIENGEGDIEGRVDITSVNNGVDYILDTEGVAKYGKIYEVVTWDDVTSPNNLLTKARAYLASKVKLTNTLTVTAVDLHLSDKDIDSFDLGMYIPVHSEPHKISDILLLTAYSLPLANPAGFVFTLGRESSSFVDTQITADRKNDNANNRMDKLEKEIHATNKNTVINVKPMFYLSSSRTTLTGGSWVETPPVWKEGFYYWQKSVTTYADGTTSESSPVCISGKDGVDGSNGKDGTNGQDGKDGADGKNGVGISGITNYYAVSTSGTTAPGSFDTTVPTLTSTNKYLWDYERVNYTDGTHKDTEKRVIGVYGDTGGTGATGVGIKSITEYYQVSSSNSTAPTSWSTTVPELSSTNKYLWNYEVITYTNDTTYTSVKRVIGVYGDKGATGGTGATGTGIDSVTVEFYLSTSKTTQTGGSWSTTMPTWSSGKYLWTRQKIVYKNPASTVYTTPICDSSWEAVNELKPEVDEAKKVATNYLDFGGEYGAGLIVGDLRGTSLGRNIHIASDSIEMRSGKTVLGRYKADSILLGQDAGKNVYIDTNGINIRDNGATLANFKTDEIRLGVNSANTTIDFCDGLARFSVYEDNDTWNRLLVTSDQGMFFSTSGEIKHTVAYSPDYGATEYYASIDILANSPWTSGVINTPRINLQVSNTTVSTGTSADDYYSKVLLTDDNVTIEATGEANRTTSIAINGYDTSIDFGALDFTFGYPSDKLFTLNKTNAQIKVDTEIGSRTGYNDGNDGIHLDMDGFIQIQRSNSSYHPYIGFYLKGSTSTYDGAIRVNQSTGYMELIGADRYTVDNVFEATGAIVTNASLRTGGKGNANDGLPGCILTNTGNLYLQHTTGDPTIYFYGKGQTSAGANIRYNVDTDYLTFNGVQRFVFANPIYGTNMYLSSGLRIGNNDTASSLEERAISTYWKDGSSHYLAYRGSDGLTSAFGWVGSSSYATVTTIRGRTCKYQNSAGTTTLSDERLKTGFKSLEDYDAFFDALEPVAFKMKNGTSGRYHIGFKAQQVERALLDTGLSSSDFAGFVRLPYTPDVDDPEGNAIFESVGIKPGDDQLGLIYTELIGLMVQQIQVLKAEVKALKEK